MQAWRTRRGTIMMRGLGFGLAALAAGGMATAAASESGEQAGKKERKICKSYGKTSSRIGRDLVCKTKAQWDADGLREAIAMEKFKTENSGRPIVTGPGSQPTRRN
jgi:hypothetical protein